MQQSLAESNSFVYYFMFAMMVLIGSIAALGHAVQKKRQRFVETEGLDNYVLLTA
jgi:hypothetical protein